MNEEREIEEMARKICKSSSVGCNFPTCAKCGIKDTCKARLYATRAIDVGYGDTKQAVIEFAERLKKLCDEKCKLFKELFDKSTLNQTKLASNFLDRRFEWGMMRNKVDELLAEVTGE